MSPVPKASAAPRGVSAVEARRLSNHDEAIDERGEVRAHYRDVWAVYQGMSKERRLRSLEESRKAFRGDNVQFPLPRLITESEYKLLKRGVEQRGEALRLFLEDYYSGRETYREIIPPDVVEAIAERNHEAGYRGLVKPGSIAFPYGPDIMRGPDGKFYVIEDNAGFLGGPGDLINNREVLFSLQPEYRDVLEPLDDPAEYHRLAVERAQQHAVPRDGKIVMYAVPPYPDNEDLRLKKIMRDLGVEVITPFTKNKLVVNAEGVFIQRPLPPGAGPEAKPALERVGYIFLNGEHKWIDASHPVTRDAYALFEAQGHLEDERIEPEAKARIEAALVPDAERGRVDFEQLGHALDRSPFLNEIPIVRRQSVHGLMEAIFQGKVATNYSPGVDFIGDKAFKFYVDDLVEFYLKEKPILRSIPVQRFTRRRADGKLELSHAALWRLLGEERYRKYVFKVVDGRGGTGVYIGPKMEPGKLPELRERIRLHPEAFVAEPFTPLSSLDGNIVDLRLLATVDPSGVLVSPTPWGRGVPMSGDGKVNISAHGGEFAVVVVPDPPAEGAGERAKARARARGKLPGIVRRSMGRTRRDA